ncbi:extracellular solute-binding protein, partial [Paenibacillus sepulcri]|nr:extracellular solute-binding protein [Paenibacillus sepulcri]
TAPDIMQLDTPWLAELNKSGKLLVDFSQEKSIDLSKFDAAFLKDFVTVNDQTIGLPMGINGRALLMNKTLADKFGISLDQPFTWDSLLEAARKVREQDKKYYLLNADSGIVQMMFQSILRQRTNAPMVKDDNTLSFNREQAIEGFQWLLDAYDAGVFQPYGESQLFYAKLEQNPKWINQEFLGIEAWSSEITKYAGVLPEDVESQSVSPPVFDDALTGASLVRPSQVVSVNKESKNTEEAVKFVNWLLTDKEAAVVLGDTRAVPAVESSRLAIVEAKKLDPDVSTAVEVASSHPATPDNVISQNSQLSEVLKDVLQKVAFKTLTPDKAADELIERLNEKIAEVS